MALISTSAALFCRPLPVSAAGWPHFQGIPRTSCWSWILLVSCFVHVDRGVSEVELVFDEPNQISAIKFWNYSRLDSCRICDISTNSSGCRTPSRGVRDVEVYVSWQSAKQLMAMKCSLLEVDDLLIYQGILRQVMNCRDNILTLGTLCRGISSSPRQGLSYCRMLAGQTI